LWTKSTTARQSVSGDENGEEMINIFGSKSFNSLGALKKMASYFRQHPMVTIWQTHFFHQIFEISSTKHIFSTFQNTINMQNRQQKLLILFTP
tara:strand:- start:524 stop:802 length:279 start_codon:yes stop_codon:yes gene_type:complete